MDSADHKLQISYHAVEKYRKITKSEQTDGAIYRKITELVKKSKEVYLKKEERLIQLLRHDCKAARYFEFTMSNNERLIFVMDMIAEGVITVHNGVVDKWQDEPVQI